MSDPKLLTKFINVLITEICLVVSNYDVENAKMINYLFEDEHGNGMSISTN